MTFFAPAKINVHLDIGPRRDDGFHDLSSIFLMVDLYDVLQIVPAPGKSGIKIVGNHGVPEDQDIILHAATALQQASGERIDAVISVRKRIPIGGGLGGGSSDAACVLKALNRSLRRPIPPEELKWIAAQIGSDVPFFFAGAAALVTGRGEKVASFEPLRTWWVLLVDPGFSIGTGEAFAWFDEQDGADREWRPVSNLTEKFLHDEPNNWMFFNSFLAPLEAKFPELITLRESIDGSVLTSISGSGSVVFSLFDSYQAAASAASGLGSSHFWLKETLASSPNGVLE